MPRKRIHRPLRPRVVFPRSNKPSSQLSTMSSPTPTSQLDTLLNTVRLEELPSNTATPVPTHYPYNPSNPYRPPPMSTYIPPPAIPPPPDLFTRPPPLIDSHTTPTSIDQATTVTSCLRFLTYPENPFPVLSRRTHTAFLESGLTEQLPSYMTSLDASRAWIIYWCLSGLATLGVDVRKYRKRVVDSLRTMQNETGGFGGGNGQMSHLTASYSAVLALVIVSGGELEEGEGEPLDLVDRVAMLRFLHSLHDPATGSFRVAPNGEADVRGVYCALTLITLLRLPTSNGLLTNTREYLSACQTYEGGFGATPGGNEAHGGYAFCALASLCMLGEPADVLASSLDLEGVVRWASARQYAPEGGLSGRTNKLVDGCYSTWVGGCWALIEAGMNGRQREIRIGGKGRGTGGASEEGGKKGGEDKSEDKEGEEEDELVPENNGVVGSLWSREGLARYILTCCQAQKGGLRDKPGKGPDFYHTCYVLLGLSSTQHYFYYVSPTSPTPPTSHPITTSTEEDLPLTAAFLWRYSKRIPSVVRGVYEPVVEDLPAWPDDVEDGAVGDSLVAQHPIFNVPFECVPAVEDWLRGKVGF